jgi:PAS domain S-box-containing protein
VEEEGGHSQIPEPRRLPALPTFPGLWADRSLRAKSLIVGTLPIGAFLLTASLSTIEVGVIAGFACSLASIVFFTASVARRVQRNEENARRLAEGLQLLDPISGRDEVGVVAEALQRASAVLTERQVALEESEAMYRTLARNFPDGVVGLFDHDLRFTLLEGKGLEPIGFTKERVEGRTITEVGEELFPTIVRAVEAQYRAALMGEKTTTERLINDRTFLVQIVPVRSDTGEVVAGMLVGLDITERKDAEEELRRAEAFLDSVVENIPNMVFVKSAEDLRFVRFNRAGEELLGSSRGDLLGKNDFDFFPPEEAEFFTSKDREVLAGGRLVDIAEERIQTRERGERFLHTRKIPILDADGHPVYLLGISEDITDRRMADAQIRESKELAERANRAKDEFLSRMSHELRTPLNAVLGFAQILEIEDPTPDQRESIHQILAAGRHLLGLIDEVLDVSRIATGRLSLSSEPVSVTDALTEAADLIRPLAVERGIRLQIDDANGLHVVADRQRLKQVLLNLLSNGVKYNREGGDIIVTWTHVTPDRLAIRVADTGVGIASEAMARLFDPFDRLGAEMSDVQGTGLGLALSKGLIEAMGGTVKAESEAGAGSVFTIELSLAEPPVDRFEREWDGHDAPPSGLTPSRTILYIEDNVSNLRLIERIISDRPQVRLLSAMQGSLGLELARDHLPDLILLDLHLPDIGGDEALRRLREDPATRTIPVVMISADATQAQIDRLLAAGANEYLTKPLDVKRFLQVVETTLDPEPAGP